MNLVIAVRKSPDCISILQSDAVSREVVIDTRKTMWRQKSLRISNDLETDWTPIGGISCVDHLTIGVFDIDDKSQFDLVLALLSTNGFRAV
jgi:hypothetical protein